MEKKSSEINFNSNSIQYFINKAINHAKKVTLVSLMPCLLLTGCVSTYNSDDIPSIINTSDITYKNMGVYPLGVSVTKEYTNCKKFARLIPFSFDNGSSLKAHESKTIRYPSDMVNTTGIEYFNITKEGTRIKTETALSTISFKVKRDEHYFVLMKADRVSSTLSYAVFSLKKGIKKQVPIVKRNRKYVDEICAPLTNEQKKLLSN